MAAQIEAYTMLKYAWPKPLKKEKRLVEATILRYLGQSAHDDGIDYDKYSRDEGGCTTSKSCQHRTKQYNENES